MRSIAVLAACLTATPLWAAPGDLTAVPAPVMGADPPKAKEIRDGDVSVSTQTGALTYSYPIEVPSGRLGMQPSLALSYSSQAPIYGGVAAGWSLSIPEIRRDTSSSWLLQTWGSPEPWKLERYVSSLAGERPLVEVSEPHPEASDVFMTYRAQNDGGFDRYERMHEGADYRWRVRSHSGVTHYFGDRALMSEPSASATWSPLTRSVDAYGNTVEYAWHGTRIHEIRYTSNPTTAPARLDFARVEFLWSPTPVCAPGTAVGRVDDRRLGIVRGDHRLNIIRATAYAPGEPGTPQHTRQITLGYDLAAARCDALHGPILQLRTIQESAWGDSEPAVTLPPVTFGYNRLERTFDQAVSEAPGWPDGRANLGWGTRDGEWPTVEGMLLDFDGDGLQDQLFMVDREGQECRFAWRKNRGADAAGHFTFDPPSAPIKLPRLPWKTGTRGAGEWCSLSGQHTEHVNATIPTLPSCTQADVFLAYRWMDLDGNGRPELVTAIHSRGAFDPNAESFFGAWPTCGARDTAACLVPEATCVRDAVTCPFGQGAGKCRFDPPALAACLDAVPRASCDVITAWASQLPTSTCVDGCKGERSCAPSDAACAADCERRCSNGSTFKQAFPAVNPGCADEPPTPRIGADLTQCLSQQSNPPEPPQPCGDNRTYPQRRCGRYPWIVYDYLRGTVAAPPPRFIYQPVPLESDSGDSSFGSTVGATNHGILDLDGDGTLDAVVRGRTYQESQTPHPSPFWGVFPGDGQGGFVATEEGATPADDVPAMAFWLAPDDAPVSASESRAPHRQSQTPSDDFDNVGVSTVVDLTGDGAPDYVWKTSSDEFGPRLRPPRNLEPNDSAVLRLFSGDGTGFEFDLTSPTDATPIAAQFNTTAPYVGYVSRSFVDVTANGGTAGAAEAIRYAKTRLVDLDADGRPDIHHTRRLNEPTLSPASWEPAALYINGGGAFLPTQAMPSAWHERLKQETVAYLQPTPGRVPGHDAGLHWETTRDLIDLDGDGLPEAWHTAGYHRDSSRQPLRLLASVDNGRGAITSVLYAPSTDGTTVVQDAATGRAMPHTQWVVASMTTTDAWDAGDTATTAYHYRYPAWKRDDEGRWGFRGFEQVTTTLPSGARQLDVYGFDVDWSGRLKASKRYEASADDDHPSTIRETSWTPRSLFGGAITTFHAEAEDAWTCNAGQSELACKAADSGRTRVESSWAAMGGQAWVATGEARMDGASYGAGDRRTVDSFHLESNATTYRLRREARYAFESIDGVTVNDAWVGFELLDYDDAWRHVDSETNYPDLLHPITTTYHHDDVGNRDLEWRPRHQGGVPRSFGYDPTGRFVVSTVNEVGHVVTAGFEPGTGAKQWEEGPNRVGANVEKTWTDVDGLGRPIATHVNRDTGAVAWVKTETSHVQYVDAIVGGARPGVIAESLIDYEGAPRWTHEETRLDSRGRPVEVRVRTGAGAPDAVTTYDYDHRGALTSVTLPDPSAAPGVVASVTYAYDFDSLGRPTLMRRPPMVDGGAASGANMSYDGSGRGWRRSPAARAVRRE